MALDDSDIHYQNYLDSQNEPSDPPVIFLILFIIFLVLIIKYFFF